MIWLIIIVLIGLLVLGGHLISETDWIGLGLILVLPSALILTIGLIALPCSYFSTKSEIQEYYSVKQTIEEARKSDINDIERASLTKKIIDVNSWLTTTKYWNNSIFDIYYPDEIEKLEPLK